MEKSRLGKSLEFLLNSKTPETPNAPVEDAPASSHVYVPVASMFPNTYQPRKVFKEDELKSLSNSIAKQGVIEPIIVRAQSDKFEIIAGERRWRASKMAGLEEVPVVVREASDRQMFEISIIENLHREDLNPIEKANAYRQLIDTFQLTQDEAAEQLGLNRTTLTNFLRLINLPDEVKNYVSRGTLSMGHARCLLGLEDPNQIAEIAQKAISKDMSVRETEKLVHYLAHGGEQSATRSRKSAEKATNVMELEEGLQERFGTKVEIKERKGKGKIVINFFSHEDFNRINAILEGRPVTATKDGDEA